MPVKTSRVPKLARRAFGRSLPGRLKGFDPASFHCLKEDRTETEHRRQEWRALSYELRKCREAQEGGNPVGVLEALKYCVSLDARARRRRARALKPTDLVLVPRWALDFCDQTFFGTIKARKNLVRIRRFGIDAFRFLIVEELRHARKVLGPKKWGRGSSLLHPSDQRKLNSKLPAAGSLFERAEVNLEDTLGEGTAEQIARSWRRVYRYLVAHDGHPGPYRIPHWIRFQQA